MNSGSTILRNFTALLCSEFIVRAATSLGAILIARSLGPQQYGILAVGLSFSFIAAYLCDLGLTHLTLQQSAKPDADLPVLLNSVLRVRMGLAAVVTTASLIWILWGYNEPEKRAVLLMIILPSIWGISFQGFGASYFWLKQELHVSAGIKTVGQLLMALALFVSFALKLPVTWVAAAYGLMSVLSGGLTMWVFRRRGGHVSGWDPQVLRGLGGFTIGGIAAMALPQIGPIFLERVTDANQLGCFAAASRIPSALCTIPGAIAMAWYPQLFHLGAREPEKHLQLCAQELKINAILGIGLALPVALYPKLIVSTILGAAWVATTAPVLSILCWMTVLNSICSPLADALTTKGLQARRAIIYSIALIAGAGLYVRFGLTAGALGGGRAAVVTMSILCAGLVLANPTGLRLVATAIRTSSVPFMIATTASVGIRLVLPDALSSAGLVLVIFFVLAVVADGDLRTTTIGLANRLRVKLESA